MSDDGAAPRIPATVGARHAVAALASVGEALDPATGRTGVSGDSVAETRELVWLLGEAEAGMRRVLVRCRDYLHHLESLGILRMTASTDHSVFDHVIMIGVHLDAARRSCGEAMQEMHHAYAKLSDLTDPHEG